VSIDNVLGRLGEERALELQLRFAEIPSATFDESRRAEAVAAAWKAAGLEPEIDESGSVVAFRPGGADGPVLCIGAHLDTVFPIDEDYSVRRPGQWCERCEEPGIVPDGEYHGPGVSDCAAGLASVTAVIESLQAADARTASPLLFVATTGEEGIGDLKGARHLFAGPWRERIGAFVTVDIGVRGAVVNEAPTSSRYRVRFWGPGGHAWDNFGRYNPLHAAGLAIGKIALFETPGEPRTTFNVGLVSGGRAINAIPEEAWFEIDLRSTTNDGLAALEAKMKAAVAEAHHELRRVTSGEAGCECDLLGHRPGGSTPFDSPLVQAAVAAIEAEGQQARHGPGSTDANIPISLGIPAIGFPWGGSERNLHSVRETYRPKGRISDVRALARLALTFRA